MNKMNINDNKKKNFKTSHVQVRNLLPTQNDQWKRQRKNFNSNYNYKYKNNFNPNYNYNYNYNYNTKRNKGKKWIWNSNGGIESIRNLPEKPYRYTLYQKNQNWEQNGYPYQTQYQHQHQNQWHVRPWQRQKEQSSYNFYNSHRDRNLSRPQLWYKKGLTSYIIPHDYQEKGDHYGAPSEQLNYQQQNNELHETENRNMSMEIDNDTEMQIDYSNENINYYNINNNRNL